MCKINDVFCTRILNGVREICVYCILYGKGERRSGRCLVAAFIENGIPIGTILQHQIKSSAALERLRKRQNNFVGCAACDRTISFCATNGNTILSVQPEITPVSSNTVTHNRFVENQS